MRYTAGGLSAASFGRRVLDLGLVVQALDIGCRVSVSGWGGRFMPVG